MFLRERMSMKSITTSPPRSRSRICRAISRAASMFALNAVSSTVPSCVILLELTSTAVSASVTSKTTAPPEGSATRRRKMFSICSSRLYLLKIGFSP